MMTKYYARTLTPKKNPYPDTYLVGLEASHVDILRKALIVDKTIVIK
jgi:hypothetical protein